MIDHFLDFFDLDIFDTTLFIVLFLIVPLSISINNI